MDQILVGLTRRTAEAVRDAVRTERCTGTKAGTRFKDTLVRSRVPTLGFAAPCSTLMIMRRLTPAASAS
ncbi:hypothetical protein StoSoilB20_41500 [Arthrobacter sp. StoSoilB20]|nr:hypothetical protein StoSoilB20_41500 [Arthrobacter sp. StoSoilB20]